MWSLRATDFIKSAPALHQIQSPAALHPLLIQPAAVGLHAGLRGIGTSGRPWGAHSQVSTRERRPGKASPGTDGRSAPRPLVARRGDILLARGQWRRCAGIQAEQRPLPWRQRDIQHLVLAFHERKQSGTDVVQQQSAEEENDVVDVFPYKWGEPALT